MPIAEKVLTAKGKKTRIGDLEFHIETVEQRSPTTRSQIKFTVTNKGNLDDYNWMNNIYQRTRTASTPRARSSRTTARTGTATRGNSVTLTLTYSPPAASWATRTASSSSTG